LNPVHPQGSLLFHIPDLDPKIARIPPRVQIVGSFNVFGRESGEFKNHGQAMLLLMEEVMKAPSNVRRCIQNEASKLL